MPCGAVAPAIEGRGDGAPGARLGLQSSDAPAEGSLWEARCADVVLCLVFALGRTLWVKAQRGEATLAMTLVVADLLERASVSF